jgi:hypothetical protein
LWIAATRARRRAGACRHLPLVLAGCPWLVPLGIGGDDEGIGYPLGIDNDWSSSQVIKAGQSLEGLGDSGAS